MIAIVARHRWWLALAAGLLIAVTALRMAAPARVADFTDVMRRFRPSVAYLLDRHGELIDVERIDFGVRRMAWVPLGAISPALVAAVIDAEDRAFWIHGGVDWRAVGGAIRDRWLHGRRRGASTISMQLASLLDVRSRSALHAGAWSHKFAQVRTAWGLEAHWSKAQILEAYLNLLEYRGELQGIGAASQVLAGKSAAGLSQAESLALVALLPDPEAAAPRIAARACARGAARAPSVPCEDVRTAVATLLTRAERRQESTRLAPQLAHALLATPGAQVRTTLDAATQRLARDVLSRHLAELSVRNVRDGAVLVVDNRSGDVLAYVGSAGPYSSAASVDGVRAHRQAGSTLKPFLYELALERHYLTAASLLDDSPVNLETATGVYIPQDYDHDFKGLVSVRTALASSLNVPAVRALVLVGVEPFRARLHDLGYTAVTESGEFYGYSLALGSAEVSLWEQAQAYRTLARGGVDGALRLRSDDPAAPERPVLTADASFIAADILSDRAARVVTFGLDNHLNTAFWSAAKTGTSKDMRDNWCIGFSRQFTVAVWVGNFEGDPMHNVSGVTGAAPVWRELMNSLHENVASLAPPPPPNVSHRTTVFDPAVETPRREWFIADTATERIVAIAKVGKIARVASPANGMIIAIDPDIPEDNQRVALTADGATAGMQLRLDRTVVGTAAQPQLWAPRRGAHRLSLETSDGQSLDRILFTVR